MHAAFPLTRAVRLRDPLEGIRAVAHLPGPFLLHSALGDDRGRWSFFGADPFFLQRGGDAARMIERFRRVARRDDVRDSDGTAAPFTGGLVG
jgi:hypothetical protein